jgi:hypothetical protein
MGRKEEVKDISKKKKRPRKKCRDEDDKLRLELRKGVSKLSLLPDDFDCMICLFLSYYFNLKPRNFLKKFGVI